MRKILSAILCAVMLFTCISCASAEPEIVPEYDSTVKEDSIDLNGQVLKMGMVQDYFFEGADSVLTYITNTELGDLAAQRLKEVQDKYNCTIEFVAVPRAGEVAFNSAVGGQYIFDFIQEESYFLVNYMKANAFVDLTSLENIDVFDESKWGNKQMLVSTMFDGGIYGVLPAAHPMRVSNSIDMVIAVNEDYVISLNATDPRDYFENGEWNWDTFTNCLNTYAHTSGISNDYVYAFSGGFGGFSRGLAMCNGIDFITIEDDNNFELGYFSTPAVEAYNQAWEWFYGATASTIDSANTSVESFIAGNSVMTMTAAYQVLSTSTSIAYQMENFGILPLPVGPNAEGQNDYKMQYSSADFSMCIPITAKDPEISALVIDKIYEPFEGYETKEDVIAYLYKNYFRDERDARFFIEMAESDHAFYHDHYHSFSTMSDQFPNTGITKGMESYRDQMLDNAEKFIVPAYATMLQYEEYFHE